MSWENASASTCRTEHFQWPASWLVLVFGACMAWLSLAEHTRAFDYQRSASDPSPKAQLLFFTARWCAPCRQIKPYITRICDQNTTAVQLIEIDYDAAPVAIQEYAVDNLPTIILLDSSGMLLMRINGTSGEALKALSKEIRRLPKIKQTREKGHVEVSDPPSH